MHDLYEIAVKHFQPAGRFGGHVCKTVRQPLLVVCDLKDEFQTSLAQRCASFVGAPFVNVTIVIQNDEVLAPRQTDIFCGTPQIAFLYGLCGLVLDPMRFGAATVLEERLKPEALVALIKQYRPTICFTTPSAFPGMLRAIKGDEVSSLRLLVAGGEPLPDVNYDKWMSLTGIPIINGLGVSELLHIFIASREGQYRHGYVGLPVTGYEVKIGDETGNQKPANELGYLFVKGPTGCRYLDDNERQRCVSLIRH